MLATNDGLSTNVEEEVTAFCTAYWTAAETEAGRASKLRLIIPLFEVEVLSGGTSYQPLEAALREVISWLLWKKGALHVVF